MDPSYARPGRARGLDASSLVHKFDFAQPPAFVEERRQWAVEPQDREPLSPLAIPSRQPWSYAAAVQQP
jgi:hypothetical protein